MRVPRSVPLLSLLLTILALVVPSVAGAATSAQVRTLTQSTYGQTCADQATDVLCTGPVSRIHDWRARISPISGDVTDLFTGSVLFVKGPLDTESRTWMADLHTTVCGDAAGITAFIGKVATLPGPGTGVGPETHGICTISGDLVLNTLDRYDYRVTSNVKPAPTILPTPTTAPTAAPTPTASPKATPTATIVAGGTPTPAPSHTALPSPTATVAPSASPTLVPSASATLAPSAMPPPNLEPTPGPIVAPVASGPVPTEAIGGIGGGGGPEPSPSLPTFSQSVLGLTSVNTEAGAIGGNLLLALLLLLIIGFAGELFNNTVENNYSEISGWFRKGPLGWLRRAGGKLGGEARTSLVVFLALTALISCFVDPHFGLDVRSLGEFLGFLVGLVVVLASFKLPMMLAHRRKTGDLGRLRPLPWALVIAALFVLVSRLGSLQPGYLYGIVLGAIFVREVPPEEEGRETFYGSFWTLGSAALGWLGLTWVRSLGYDPADFGVTLLSTAFAAILVAGLEATAFGLMPLRFMPGHAVYRWNRLGWGLLFGLAAFAFIHLLISPTSGYVSTLSPQAFIAACGVFAAFGGLSIATWAYFRFKPRPA
jgi:hypothetical protein